ncbi:winged helix-turn-helix transcriptional regulator [Candidatus Woesearchaeota archaeon]|jgi:predicted transcriptional regulator|nr:winged helix-turn-helix transcriptional regulator [Candidatus Woesearchaeota archaeon]MBT7062686.1 winged helix-turn-helix transcriptional regulator [Candidatus Woesearchaeota archaeon]MBT7402531.1 winged helix-turn-helix transcriptional regulator [Candidatus Woesearchaeota archaeon]
MSLTAILCGAIISNVFYTRLDKNRILAHDTRMSIINHLRTHKSVTKQDINEGLKLNNKRTTYHLEVLLQANILGRSSSRQSATYFIKNDPPDIVRKIINPREKIYTVITDNPGIHYNEIKRTLGIPQTTLSKNLKNLLKLDEIESKQDGSRIRYYSTERTNK